MQRHTTPPLMTRRQALTVTLAGLLTALSAGRLRAEAINPTVQTATAAKPKSVTLFTLSGAGDEDGRDWQNAMPIDSLSKALSSARPGSGFLIGFDSAGQPIAIDKGQIRIKASGDESNPVFLQAGLIADDNGVAAASKDVAAFFKSAQPWSVKDFGRRGSAYFALIEGASHLRVSGFHIDGTPADGFFKFRGKETATFRDIVISGLEARNVGRVIETDRGAMLQNLIVTDCRAIGIIRGFARFRHLSDSTLRNLELDAAKMDAGGRNVCQLIAVSEGKNLLFEDIVLRNAINEPPPPKEGKEPGYVQGDGIVCERKTMNVTIRNCHASSMGDGGFDLKTTNVTMEDCSSDSCKFGARLWAEGNNVIRRCDFRNPVSRNDTQGACIQAGGTLEIVDTKLHAGRGTVAISLSKKKNQNPPMVVMRGGSIEIEGNAKVAHASADGVLELQDVMVNGVKTSRRFVFEKKEK
ncbi:right-handed parallel beta-helix repeat-containing protein [Dongia deserti]|uniref:right-handed parallel beta-helix repeat-containing protein n=1 Tax=Dongia deserti TaxID=2268030 RepID=UPI0013C45560|nr:right-handed parallel beta-helix repeat-containing protein [Dongia deserti]